MRNIDTHIYTMYIYTYTYIHVYDQKAEGRLFMSLPWRVGKKR